MNVSQAEYNTRMERFKAAMRRSADLNVCKMVGRCTNGCIGRGARCPYLPSDPATLAAAQAEYDAAFEALENAEVVAA
jgi:hypothetical protein